jgi:tryptophan synthase alpha chain
MNRIERKFRELKKAKKKAFIAFITAGYPNLETTKKLILEFSRIGVDIIELGIPFSDPIADGAVIQEASQAALKKKTTLQSVLALVRSLRKTGAGIPICFMSYYNPIFCYGEARFIRDAATSGVDGIIIPDLATEEGRSFARQAKKAKLDTIFFISPTTSKKRMRMVSKISTGFIYYVSLTGVTGARLDLPCDISRHLKIAKSYVSKPLCVGFGVSTAGQVRQIQSVADGVIVGSAIIKKIKENIGNPNLVKRVASFVAHLKG